MQHLSDAKLNLKYQVILKGNNLAELLHQTSLDPKTVTSFSEGKVKGFRASSIEAKNLDIDTDIQVHRIPIEVLEEAFEIANGDHSLVVIDKEEGKATVYNTAELALEALKKGNKQYPSRYTQFRFKSSKD